MLGKNEGRKRVYKVLARAGYGKGGAKLASGGASSQRHDGIAAALSSIQAEVEGKAPKGRLDRKARASGGKTANFHPGGEKGKLHREIGVSIGKKIPTEKLTKAAHSKSPEIRRDAIRAETMKKWKH